jgi:methionine synthase II (cobalamin-independent)
VTAQPLLTTTVGSFPKPAYLLEARRKHARKQLGPEELEALERRATEEWIRRQEEIGMDILVDGEMYRGDMVAFFADQMDGFAIAGMVRSYGNRYYPKPAVVRPVGRRAPVTVGWWKFAQGLTPRPVKGMLTGPYTITRRAGNSSWTSPGQSTMRPWTWSAPGPATFKSTNPRFTRGRTRTSNWPSRRWRS